MDPDLITYYSDSDYCLRARRAGYRIGYTGQASYVFHKSGQSSRPDEEQGRVLFQDYLTFWRKWLGGPEHAVYLQLMGNCVPARGSALATRPASDLQSRPAPAFPELRRWLDTLPPEIELNFGDIVQHFQHQAPATRFAILANIARELSEG